MKGWVTKHIPPSFSFIGQKKKRFFILSDRMIYAFKSDQAGSCYRELFQLTKSTQVFVTDHFSGVSNCLEIQKKDENDLSWYFQAPDSATMQVWLQLLKKTILWLRTDPQGPCNPTELISIPNEGDYRYSYMLSTSERSTSRHSQTIMRSSMHSSNNVNTSNARYSATYPSTQFSSIKRSSYSPTTAQGGFMGTLPPPLPPPTHAPPPPPKVFHL
ncbi:hypothetical protein BDF14DRAFT_1770589 [Spinellus fusiger]|nr:hypothetical protein BDF14DRAFT_1770589 [Spinellus fusiger]